MSGCSSRRLRALRAGADALAWSWEYHPDARALAAALLRSSLHGNDRVLTGLYRVALAAALTRTDQAQEAQHQLMLAAEDATTGESPELLALVAFERAFLTATQNRLRNRLTG